MLECVLVRSVQVVHESADDSYDVRNIRSCHNHCVHKGANCRCIQYRLHIFPLWIGCRAISLRQPKVNGERGRSRLGRLHVEAFQDTSDVVSLRQKKSCRFSRCQLIFIPSMCLAGPRSFMANFNRSFGTSSVSSLACRPGVAVRNSIKA